MFFRKIFLIMVSFIVISGEACASSANEYKWVEGKLQAIYSSNYSATSVKGNVAYYLAISEIKMIRLDMNRIDKSNDWQALIGQNIEVKVSKDNVEKVRKRELRAYVVLDVRYKKILDSKKNAKNMAVSLPNAKKPWINLLCKFPDIDTVPHDSDFYQTMFGNTYPYLEHYWKETTYGYIDIAGTQTTDWITLPHNYDYYKPAGQDEADITLLREDCIAASGTSDTLGSYYGKNLFFNGILFDQWAGRGGGDTTWIDLGSEGSLGTVAHEMGHAYGLSHSSGRYGGNYDSPWDVMSNAYIGNSFGSYNSIPQHTIAYHKQILGAINVNAQWSNAQFDASSGEVIHLSRLEENAVAGDYLIANVFTAGNTKHFTIETRDKIGYDSSLPAKAVIIHEIENGRAYVVDTDNNGDLSDAGAQWQAGETFTDINNTISIEILSATATGYNILISAPRVKPEKVKTVTASEDLVDRVRVTWSPVNGATYYKVLRYESWSLDSNYTEFTTNNNGTFYDDVPNDYSLHAYRVKACNIQGCSPVSTREAGQGQRKFMINASDGTYDDKVIILYATLPSFVKSLYLFRHVEGNNSSSVYLGSIYRDNQKILEDITALRNVKYKYIVYLYDNQDNYIGYSEDIGYSELDTDNDGIGNNTDTDDDNDGILDVDDDLPLNPNESVDTDHDGIGNNADTDDDNDGILDVDDDLPLNPNESIDTDHDGIGNNADTDDDNDGVLDVNDDFPLDSTKSTALANIEQFVTRFYQVILGRTPDSAGLLDWSSELEGLSKSGADIAKGFIFSAEYDIDTKSDTEYLNTLYSAFFDRAGDAGGLTYWHNQIALGASRADVLDGFLNSLEFINLAESYGIIANATPVELFVSRFYKQTLLRNPDAAGLADWVNRLNTGIASGSDVAFGFVFSGEFIARNLNNNDFVTVLYRAFFGREPDTGGFNGWMTQLNSGTSREEVLQGFLGAPEFAALAASYGIRVK